WERSAAEPALRSALLEALALLGGEQAEAKLGEALYDVVPEVRVAAVQAMGRIGRRYLELLIAALGSPDTGVRLEAANLLGGLGDLQAIDPLVALLSDAAAEVRRAARESLLRLGWHPIGWKVRPEDKGSAYWSARADWASSDPQEAQLPILLRALAEADPDRRRNAADALGLVGNPAALAGLRRAAAADLDLAVRRVAAAAAAQLERPAGEQTDSAERLLQAAAAAGDAAAAARQLAAALGEAGDPRPRAAAAEALGMLGAALGVPALAGALSDRDAGVRAAAAAALGRLGGADAEQALAAVLGDPVVAPIAAFALAGLGGTGVSRLVVALQSGDAQARRWAATGLGASGDAAVQQPLLQATRDPGHRVRAAAALALGELHARPAETALLGLLAGDESPEVRAAAATALGQLAGNAAVAGLQQGLADPAEPVCRSCLAALDAAGSPASEELQQAARAIGQRAWPVCAALGAPAVPLLLRVLEGQERVAESRDPERRAGAALALGDIGDSQAAALSRALLASEPLLQAASARALGRLGHQPARVALHDLCRSAVAELRAAALEALGQLGQAEDLPLLQQGLADEARPVRLAALAALAGFGEVALPAIGGVLRREQDEAGPQLRVAAAALLGQLGLRHGEAIEPLVEALQSDPVDEVRQQAAHALELLGWVPLTRKLRVRELCARLSDPEAEARRAAALELAELGDEDAVRPLHTLLADGEAEVAAAAGLALIRLGEQPEPELRWLPGLLASGAWEMAAALGRPALTALTAVLTEKRKDRRLGAVTAIAAIGGRGALEPLLQTLADPEPEVRRQAARGLGALPVEEAPAAVAALAARLDDASAAPEVALALARLGDTALTALGEVLGGSGPLAARGQAAFALGRTRRPEAFPLLAVALEAEAPEVRRAAAEALGPLGRSEAVPLLCAALRADLDDAVRQNAAASLALLGDAQAVPLLRSLLGDSQAVVRRACGEALRALGQPPSAELLAMAEELAAERWTQLAERGEAALELLLVALRTPGVDERSAATRAAAARTMGEIRSPAVLQPLLAALGDGQWKVQCAVALALERHGDGRAEPELRELAGRGHPVVRAACLRSLLQLGSTAVLPLLAEALGDPHAEVRQEAFALAGQADDAAITEKLCAVLEPGASVDAPTRLLAIAALVAQGRPTAVDSLVLAMGDGSPEVRRAAWDAQLALGWHPVGWRAQRKDASYTCWTPRSLWLRDDPHAGQAELLLDVLRHDPDPARRRNAAEALGLCRAAPAIASLRRALEQDEDRDVRIVAAEALERLGVPPAEVPAWLPSWVERGRWDVCVTLGEPAVAELAFVLAEPDRHRRAGAIAALVRIGSAAAQAVLLRATHDVEPELRAAAAAPLARAGTAAALPRLIELLDDAAVAPVITAACTVHPSAEARPALRAALLGALQQGTTGQRRWSAACLAGCPAPAVEAALLRALDDEETEVAIAAAGSLGQVGGKNAASPLAALLQQAAAARLRAAAATALGRCGTPASKEALVAGLGDGWGEVRRASA
ncbi:MAG: hypothetical protein FJ125_02450, partial [Deltaproteobacteria bacterium]|nr:hypothetical protein [Deltaproteobacteria bacterium]